MFVGHAAVALLARRHNPSISLGAFLVATFALDLVWPVFLLFGVEQVRMDGTLPFGPLVFVSYPWSHSLLLAMGWGLLAAFIARSMGIRAAGAMVLGLVVVSHWVLDFITHVPDLQLAPGLPLRVGLGLWRSIPATFLVEGTFYVIAIFLYMKATRPRDGIGVWGIWSYLVLCGLLWASGPWGGAPPSVTVLACLAMGVWLLIALGAWGDRHRVMRG